MTYNPSTRTTSLVNARRKTPRILVILPQRCSACRHSSISTSFYTCACRLQIVVRRAAAMLTKFIGFPPHRGHQVASTLCGELTFCSYLRGPLLTRRLPRMSTCSIRESHSKFMALHSYRTEPTIHIEAIRMCKLVACKVLQRHGL